MVRRLVRTDPQTWSEEDAMAMISSVLDDKALDLMDIIVRRFMARGDRRIGFYTLLLDGGSFWNPDRIWSNGQDRLMLNPAKEYPDSALAQYLYSNLKLLARDHQQQDLHPDKVDHSFFKKISGLRYLATHYVRMSHEREPDRKTAYQVACDYLTHCDDLATAWLVVALVPTDERDVAFHQILAQVLARLGGDPAMRDVVRSQEAQRFFKQNKFDEARRVFIEIFNDRIDRSVAPMLGENLRQAFTRDAAGRKIWNQLWKDGVARLIKKGMGRNVVELAWLNFQLGDSALADTLLSQLLTGPSATEDKADLILAVQYYLHTDQDAEANQLVQSLIQDDRYKHIAFLWRLAAVAAQRRNELTRSVKYQHHSLDIQMANLPDRIDLEVVRREFGQLLRRYELLATAWRLVGTPASDQFAGNVMRAADQWRALDYGNKEAYDLTASVLMKVNETELAWGYLTTVLADYPNDALSWLDLAQMLRDREQYELADRAYATAFEITPTNARALWNRAHLLQKMGRTKQARELFRKIAEGKWTPQFEWLQTRAKLYLEK